MLRYLAIALILSTGMGIGSLHNAQVREALPGFFTPLGFMLIALTFIAFLAGLLVLLYSMNAGGFSRLHAIVASGIATVIQSLNLVTTLASEGSLEGWLFHEYLGVIVAPLILATLLVRKLQT